MSISQRPLTDLAPAESLRLLSSVSLGRIVFTHRALPAIRVVRHLVDRGDIVVCSHEAAAVVPASDAVRGVVVAYEADAIDPDDHRGWSVLITGLAYLAGGADEVARYRQVMRPWKLCETGEFICIHPQLITGFRL